MFRHTFTVFFSVFAPQARWRLKPAVKRSFVYREDKRTAWHFVLYLTFSKDASKMLYRLCRFYSTVQTLKDSKLHNSKNQNSYKWTQWFPLTKRFCYWRNSAINPKPKPVINFLENRFCISNHISCDWAFDLWNLLCRVDVRSKRS